jgi:16S rRNA C967 or C1407 C5-methylase (RsmB/RsmF family)/NOL1/NOP2/fmu family ribosome biogenesis protein
MEFDKKFIDKMISLLGEEGSSRFFDSLNTPSQKAITLNTHKMSREEFENIKDFEISPIPEVENGYYVDNLKIGTHMLNHLGVIYSQEPSAMYPVEMLDISEGEIVLDLCSAPGGKSIQILEKLNGTGLLVSNEIVYNRAKILYENLTRMGFRNSAITCNSPQDFEKTNLKFDKILVDAPCGGEGMFRKDNFDFDAYNNASIDTNARRQMGILNSIKGLLKNGGLLVYSTCTYDIRENEEVVTEFLRENPQFELIDCPKLNSQTTEGVKVNNYPTNFCKRRYPHLHRGEGQFMALLRKNGEREDYSEQSFRAKGFESVYKKDIEVLRQTFKNIADIKQLELIKRNENIYALPDIVLNFENLNLVSIGCLVGTVSGKIFKIAHEFYHNYGDIFNNKIELDDNQCKDYVRGYEVDTDHNENGICVLTRHRIPLGGGKVVGGKIKNYYPKNLRNN